MATPTLLLSADGSRDRSGPVSPTVGAGVSVVAGTYGQSWQRNSDTDGLVRIASTDYLVAGQGTVLARMTGSPIAETGSQYALATNSGAFRILLLRETTTTNPDRARFGIGNPVTIANADANSAPGDTLITYALTWSEDTASAYLNGNPVTTFGYTQGDGVITTIFTGLTGAGTGQRWEGCLCYDTPLTATQIDVLSMMPEAWTWDAVVDMFSASRTLHPVLKIGSSHIGPMRVGERN